MYLNGAGDFPIVMNQYDMSNLEFTLVDSNYHPIKLFSPMFVIMKVEKTPNPMEDIKVFQGKLPRDRSTRQQIQQMQIENQKTKAKNDQNKQIVVDALAKVAEQLLPQVPAPQPEVEQPPEVPQVAQLRTAQKENLRNFWTQVVRPQDMDDEMREDILRSQRAVQELEQEIENLADPDL
jgi:hypothetical protein